jgi:hypothetical protein
MFDAIITFLFGFGGAFIALILAVIGAATRWLWVGVLGLLLSLPFAFYLTATPRFRFWGWLLPGLIAAGLVAAWRKRKVLAWIGLALAATFAGWIFWLVQA